MKVLSFSSKKKWLEAGSKLIASVCQKSSPTSIGLSGGGTPQPIYESLSKNKKIHFGNVHFYEVDERMVSTRSKYSNQAMIQKALIKPLKNTHGARSARAPNKHFVRVGSFHAFDTSLSIAKSLQQYEAVVKKIPHQRFDLMILGIGPDGHIASLFPGTKALKAKQRLTAHTTTKQFDVYDRLTLTLKPIIRSKKILVLLQGSAKRQMLEELLESHKTVDQFPAKILLKHPDVTIHWLT